MTALLQDALPKQEMLTQNEPENLSLSTGKIKADSVFLKGHLSTSTDS